MNMQNSTERRGFSSGPAVVVYASKNSEGGKTSSRIRMLQGLQELLGMMRKAFMSQTNKEEGKA